MRWRGRSRRMSRNIGGLPRADVRLARRRAGAADFRNTDRALRADGNRPTAGPRRPVYRLPAAAAAPDGASEAAVGLFKQLLRTPVGPVVKQVSRGLRAVGSPVNPHRMLNTAMFRGMEDVLADPRCSMPPFPHSTGTSMRSPWRRCTRCSPVAASLAAFASFPKPPCARRPRSKTTNGTGSSW